MKVINLTPHEITIFAKDGSTVIHKIPSSGVVRVSQVRESAGDIDGIPVNKTAYGALEGLPDPHEGVIYIVSALTAQAAPDRGDLYMVDETVRDEAGRVMGCRALAQA